MGNLIWTGILYFSTSAIVFIVYRTFVNDRKAENERRTSDVVFKAQAQAKAREAAAMSAPRRAARRPAMMSERMEAPAVR